MSRGPIDLPVRVRRAPIALAACAALLALAGCEIAPRRAIPAPRVADDAASGAETDASRAEVVVPPFGGQLTHALVDVTGELPGGAFDVDVAPEADRIVFACDAFSARPKLFVKPVAGGSPVQRTFGAGSDIQPKWSPDGKWIAFASDRDGNYDIHVIAADGSGGAWQVTRDSADELHPSWSPDGASLAYCAQDPTGVWFVWRVRLEGSVHTQLVPGLFPEWSPDGGRIAFQAPSARGAGCDEIWVVGIDGQGLSPVVSDPRFGAVQPSWDPYGERIVFASIGSPLPRPWETPASVDLWVTDLRGAPPSRLTSDPARDGAPCWGLDGRIYFSSDRRGGMRIHSMKSAGPDSPFRGDEPISPEESP